MKKRPDRITPKVMRPKGRIDAFLGLLVGKGAKKATIEEMNEAAADGWATGSFDKQSVAGIGKLRQ